MDPIDLAKSVKPITAYHGSPHDFDEFDTANIGTGEGAQKYGHGLYFAEHEPVAKGYRDDLSANQPTPIKVGEERHHPYSPMQRIVAEHKGDVDAVLKKMMPRWEKIAETHRNLSPDTENLERYLVEDEHNEAQKQRAEVESMRGKTVEYGPKGHMYEVHIDAHPDHFLDWDKPLSEQSEHVKNAIRDWEIDYVSPNLTGGRLVEEMQKGFGEKGASEALQKTGIHGIKYLDEGSRGYKPWTVTHPQGGVNEFNDEASAQAFHARNPKSSIQKPKLTNNYVVFDHNRVSVKRKYATGGYVRRPYKKGGKVEGSIWHNKDADLQYRGLSGSQIVEHALNKIAAPLPASILHQGSVTGRRH